MPVKVHLANEKWESWVTVAENLTEHYSVVQEGNTVKCWVESKLNAVSKAPILLFLLQQVI